MKSIQKNINNEIIINKSRFITEMVKIKSLEEINKELKTIKNKYKNANHYCYAYILDNIKKASDDKEPSGTAGIPILNVLTQNDMNYILCVVIRYFGGIKLGVGGLQRAYNKSVVECLKLGNIIDLKKGIIIQIEFEYKDEKNINNILKSKNITKKEFNDNIMYEFEIDLENYNLLKDKLKSYTVNIKEKENMLIEY